MAASRERNNAESFNTRFILHSRSGSSGPSHNISSSLYQFFIFKGDHKVFPTFRPRRSCAVRSSAVTEQRLLRSPDRSQHNTLNFWWRGGGAPGGKESGAAADQRGAALLPPGCVVRFSAPAGTLLVVLFWPDQQRKMGEADYTGSSRPVVHSGHPHQKICLGCFPKENIFCFT